MSVNQMCTCGYKVVGETVAAAWELLDEHVSAVHGVRDGKRPPVPEHSGSWPWNPRAPIRKVGR